MAIYIGSTQIRETLGKIYVGNTEVKKVYVGSTLVWEKYIPPVIEGISLPGTWNRPSTTPPMPNETILFKTTNIFKFNKVTVMIWDAHDAMYGGNYTINLPDYGYDYTEKRFVYDYPYGQVIFSTENLTHPQQSTVQVTGWAPNAYPMGLTYLKADENDRRF